MTDARPAPADGPTVLVVDDDADLLALCVGFLRRAGYVPVGAADGRDALDAVARLGRPDLLFTDVVMPDVDGFTLAAELTRRDPGLGVVYATGRPDADARARAASQGSTLLPKPYTSDQVLAALAGARHGRS